MRSHLFKYGSRISLTYHSRGAPNGAPYLKLKGAL